MEPQKIIIKTLNPAIAQKFCSLLNHYTRIHFFCKKINGEYRIIISCHPFYVRKHSKNYGKNNYDYIYLYTAISIILCDVIIDFYEEKIVTFWLKKYFYYLDTCSIQKIKNIISLMLDANYPSYTAQKVYFLKKDLILNQLMQNFKHQNHLMIDSFSLFSLKQYHYFLSEIVLASFDISQ